MDSTLSNGITPTHRNEESLSQSPLPPDLSEHAPYVRYAGTGDDGSPRQLPRLHSIDEPAPPEADFISPVYFLTDRQVERQEEVLNRGNSEGWAVSGSCIAKELQNECEESDRVLYPVFIESDSDVPFHRMRDGLKRFIRDVFDVEPDECRWFFSGGRSIHVHLPCHVRSHNELERLRREAEQFNEEGEVTVDASNYSRKSMVRLPGAEHHRTDIRKLPIRSDSKDEELLKRIAQMKAGVPPHIEKEEVSYTAGNVEIARFSLSQELALIKDIPTPVVEQEEKPHLSGKVERWKQYNRHPFSPYANTGDERRSIVVAQVKGTPFCRDESNQDIDRGTFVPAYVYGAVGADGQYQMWRENGRIRLSDKDYDKWEYESGDTVVIIGGKSTSSRIIQLDNNSQRKSIIGTLLSDSKWAHDGQDGRMEALDLLREMGYDVGSPGKNGPCRTEKRREGEGVSHAGKLQRRTERDGVETLSHQERLHVANRLLSNRGWDGADEWFQEQFGEWYDRELTHKYLRSIAKKYDDLPSPPT